MYQLSAYQSHQLSPFKSIAPRQVAFTHDFAEISRRLFLLWRHNFVTWPDPTKFFSLKVAQRMPHKLWKISARSSKWCGVQLRKTHGGVASTPPPPDRARVNIPKTITSTYQRDNCDLYVVTDASRLLFFCMLHTEFWSFKVTVRAWKKINRLFNEHYVRWASTLTRALLGLWIFHHLMGGGGVWTLPG